MWLFNRRGMVTVLAAVTAVIGAACLMGCGGDSGTNTGGNNTGGNNTGNNFVHNTNNGNTPPKTVEIGGVTWMKENLNIQTADSWCYGEGGRAMYEGTLKTLTSSEIQTNCNKYGRLYTWEAAEAACQLAGNGWRLPTREDWKALEAAAGGGSTAGKHLKSRTGWTSYSGIENLDTYGFSALPGGYRNTDGSFNFAGISGYWWTAAVLGSGAFVRYMVYINDSLIESGTDVSVGSSVRCVRD
jgi:uncharacterized protein (TIGR02145 family)